MSKEFNAVNYIQKQAAASRNNFINFNFKPLQNFTYGCLNIFVNDDRRKKRKVKINNMYYNNIMRPMSNAKLKANEVQYTTQRESFVLRRAPAPEQRAHGQRISPIRINQNQ